MAEAFQETQTAYKIPFKYAKYNSNLAHAYRAEESGT
jgi:hypothetical protein